MRPHQYQLQNYSRPWFSFFPGEGYDRRGDETGALDLNPIYQRASVWTLKQRRNLILSISQGLPVGAVFLNDRGHRHGFAVIDGKQRIEAVRAFVSDEFGVPGAWFDLPGGIVRYSGLRAGDRRGLGNVTVATYQVEFRGTLAEMERQEIELYARINYGGTPHDLPA